MNARKLFEETLRWPGAPKICQYENLPAFATEKQALEFHEANHPGGSVLEKWICPVCTCWHYIAAPPVPAGATSGSGREYKRPIPRYRREALNV